MLPVGWAELIALLDGHLDADPMSRVKRLCELCVQVAGVTGVALGITSGSSRSTVCVTDEVSDRLEELQFTVGEGPSTEAARDGSAVLTPSLDESGGRWPAFVPAALEAGAQAVFTFPLRIGAIHLGVLALYRTTPGSLTFAQFKDAEILAEAASVLLTLHEVGEETAAAFVWMLGDGSRFRPEVHQAVGATMVHLRVDARDAYARLCAFAYSNGLSIGTVAHEVMARRLQLDLDQQS